MKNKTPKPRVMWAAYYNTPNQNPTLHRSNAEATKWTGVARTVRVAVIPLDDIEAIVERAALALLNEFRRQSGFKAAKQFSDFSEQSQECFGNKARAALTAAGIPCKRKARK
jgi:hypothetical protein